jgi:hypothetical protein
MVKIIEYISGIGKKKKRKPSQKVTGKTIQKPRKGSRLNIMVVIVGVFLTAAVFGTQQDGLLLVVRHGKPPPDFFHAAVASNTNFMFIKGTNVNTRIFYG